MTGFEKRDHFAQNVKSCYDPVKFTCPLGNVVPDVFSISGTLELNEI